ncbi:MAG: hypothetical protein HKN88_09205 [Gammaproteobacteria bacterium]|nr:hypothetical protein [Gammaproteobacteria bacterium]
MRDPFIFELPEFDWCEIKSNEWKTLPCLSGRTASQEDVQNGSAVFTAERGSLPHAINLPACALYHDVDKGKKIPSVIIQAEAIGEEVYLGIRFFTGGNAVCKIDEVELIGQI